MKIIDTKEPRPIISISLDEDDFVLCPVGNPEIRPTWGHYVRVKDLRNVGGDVQCPKHGVFLLRNKGTWDRTGQ